MNTRYPLHNQILLQKRGYNGPEGSRLSIKRKEHKVSYKERKVEKCLAVQASPTLRGKLWQQRPNSSTSLSN